MSYYWNIKITIRKTLIDVKNIMATDRTPEISGSVSKSFPKESKFVQTGTEFGAVAYFQQRLLFGGDELNPDTLYGTELGNYYRFGVSEEINDPSNALKIGAEQVLLFQHLKNLSKLIAFGLQGEFLIASNEAGVIDANPSISRQSQIGCSDLTPIQVGETACFVNRNRNRVYDINYRQGNNKFTPTDITLRGNHFFKGYKLVDMTFQQDPHNNIWCVRDDGKVVICTYVKEEGIKAWTLYDFGGKVKSVCCIPEVREHGGKKWFIDSVYMAIERKMKDKDKDGNDVKNTYIERTNISEVVSKEDWVFMDSAKEFDGFQISPK